MLLNPTTSLYKRLNLRYDTLLKLSEYTLLLLTGLIIISGCTKLEKTDTKNLEQLAENCFQQGDYIGAINKWTELIRQGAADAFSYEQMGIAQKRLGNLQAALDAFRQSVKLDPGSMSALQHKAALEIFFADVPAASETLGLLEKLGRSPNYYILHGDLLCVQGKYKEAEDSYRTILATDPHNETALARLAFCLLAMGKQDESLSVYRQLSELPPKKAETLSSMGQYWFIQKDFSKAEDFMKKAAATEPDNLELQIRLAGFYIDMSRYKPAITVFKRILHQNPSNLFARKMLIELNLLSGDIKAAKEQLSEMGIDGSKDLEFALLAGKCCLLEHNLPQAASYFQEAIDQEPNLVVAHYLLGVTYLSMGHGNLGKSELIKAVSLDKTFTDAELALSAFFYKKGKYDIAKEYAQRVRDKEPGNVKAYLLLGNIYLMEKQIKKAAEMLRTAKAMDPSQDIPDYYGAMIAASTLPFKEAVKQYQNLLSQYPRSIDIVYDYAQLLVSHGKGDEAEAFLKDDIHERPYSPWLYCISGEIYLKMNRLDEAVQAYRDAINIDARNSFAYERLVSLLSERKDGDKELEHVLDMAIKNNLMVPDLYITLADIYTRTGRHKQAIELLEQAKQRMPGNPEIANNLAWYYLMPETRDVSRAFELALSANEQFPDRPDIMDTLAWVYYFKGLYTQSHWLLEACIEKGADNPVIRYHLGMVYAAEGRTEDARKQLLLSKKTGVSDKYVDQEAIKRTLAKLDKQEAPNPRKADKETPTF